MIALENMQRVLVLFTILITVFICIGITIIPILSGNFYFTFDQARDAIWVKNQIDFHKLSLIGPWGSLNGVFFGPLWFWLLMIPSLLFGGNPIALTLFNSFFVFGTVMTVAFLLYKYSPRIACFFCLLGFASVGVRNMAGTAFAQHMLPLFTFIYIYSLVKLITSSQTKYLYLGAFCLSLLFHAEPPMLLFSLPAFCLTPLLIRDKKKIISFQSILLTVGFFLLPFIPFILFEARHDFLQTKGFIEYFLGRNQSLGDILPFGERLLDRPRVFFSMFQLSVFEKSAVISFVLLISTMVALAKFPQKKFLWLLLKISFLYVTCLLILFLLYRPQLKLFYLDGIQLVYIFWVACLFDIVWKRRHGKYMIILFLMLLIWFNLDLVGAAKDYRENYSHLNKTTSIFNTQIGVVDWIYKRANNRGFKVYTYQPAVYDYPYQYLFLWYGMKKYKYLPEEFSYLPNKDGYVESKKEQLTRLSDSIKKSENLIFLTIEKDIYNDRVEQWKQNFPNSSYPVVSEKSFPDGTIVQERTVQKSSRID